MIERKIAAATLVACCIGAGASAQAPQAYGPTPSPSTSVDGLSARAYACSNQAAAYHRVNPQVLRAILRVESGGRPFVIRRNNNGTLDIGIAQINSVHLRELHAYGIRAEHLFDECIATFVAAWHYARQIQRYGNTWYAIGAYHSRTPSRNQRYQARVWNELMRSGTYSAGTSALDSSQHKFLSPVPNTNKAASVAAATGVTINTIGTAPRMAQAPNDVSIAQD